MGKLRDVVELISFCNILRNLFSKTIVNLNKLKYLIIQFHEHVKLKGDWDSPNIKLRTDFPKLHELNDLR